MTKKEKSNGYGKGTWVDTQLFLSKAFISLTGKGAQVLLMFLGKRQFGTVKDKGNKKQKIRIDENKFFFTLKEAKSHGISQGTFTRAIDELLKKGFIEKLNPGGAYKQDKAVYALVDDYILWRPNSKPIRERQKGVKRGFQGAKKGAVKKFSHAQVEPYTHAQVEPYEAIHTHT